MTASSSGVPARLLTAGEVSEILGRTTTTLRNWRWRGEGPAFIRYGNRVHYRADALARWIEEHETDPASSGRDEAA